MSSKLCPVAIVFTPIFFAANSIPLLRNGPQIEHEVTFLFSLLSKTLSNVNPNSSLNDIFTCSTPKLLQAFFASWTASSR